MATMIFWHGPAHNTRHEVESLPPVWFVPMLGELTAKAITETTSPEPLPMQVARYEQNPYSLNDYSFVRVEER